jgi:hypothetical protein
MTNKLFHSLAILVLAFFAGQSPQLMARSSRIDRKLEKGVPAMRRAINRAMRAHPPTRPNTRALSEAGASGLTKQEV